MNPTFASPFASAIERFLQHKRALGHRYRREEAHLRAFDRLASARSEALIGEGLVRAYLSEGSGNSRPHRLTLVRQLTRFIALDTPQTFVPPARFLGIRRLRPPIRVFSRQECVRFLSACEKLPSTASWPERGLVHGTALRTLLLTGLRRKEALRLRNMDVDLQGGVLTVLGSKFGKSRFVPLAPDLTQRLTQYRSELATRNGGRRPTDAFFPGPDGCRSTSGSCLYTSFRRVLVIAGITHHGRGEGPRCHDLRHAFAGLRLLSWYEQGEDLTIKLPLLATYLGHVGLSSSQVYLHMTQDLVGEITRRYQERFGDVVTTEGTP